MLIRAIESFELNSLKSVDVEPTIVMPALGLLSIEELGRDGLAKIPKNARRSDSIASDGHAAYVPSVLGI